MTLKGRPKKIRYMQEMPRIVQFSPRGKPGRPDEVELMFEQLEAIKLADFQGFSQEQGAVAMRLSRASFGRILRKAREKIADALVNGKTINIRMGDTQVGVKRAEFTQETLQGELARFQTRNSKITEEIEKLTAQSTRPAKPRRKKAASLTPTQ